MNGRRSVRSRDRKLGHRPSVTFNLPFWVTEGAKNLNRIRGRKSLSAILSISLLLSLFAAQLTAHAEPRKSQWTTEQQAEDSSESTAPDVGDSLTEDQKQDEQPSETAFRKEDSESVADSEQRIIVKYKNGASINQIQAKLAAAQSSTPSSTPSWELAASGLGVMKISSTADMEKAIAQLKKDSNVLYAEPDYKIQIASIPNDPRFGDQWGLHNEGQPADGDMVDDIFVDGGVKLYGTVDTDINAPEAWEITQGSADVVVAVLDTGIDIAHPDLVNNIWTNKKEIPDNGVDDDGNGFVDDVHGWDFYNKDNSLFDAWDGDIHGTQVAGILAASANNGIGIAGTAPNVAVLPLKVIGPDGTGYISDVIQAIQYAEQAGAQIANLSWVTSIPSVALEEAIEASSLLFVTAAGNDLGAGTSNAVRDLDVNPVYPAAYDSDNILSVAGMSFGNELIWYSNYGQKTVDVAAPATSILSTVPTRNIGLGAQIDNGTYKAIVNNIGFEFIQDDLKRREAFKKALQYLKPSNGTDPKILLVQDDESEIPSNLNTLPVYQTLLDSTGYDYDTLSLSPGEVGPSLDTLNSYDLVIWFTGTGDGAYIEDGTTIYRSTNLTETDQLSLTGYLNGGGRLLLSGPMALAGIIDSSFVNDMLHLEFVRAENTDNESWNAVSGVSGSLYDGLAYTLTDTGMYADMESNAPLVTVMNLEIPTIDYARGSGTSFAAPFASGAAALLFSEDPSGSAEDVKERIMLGGKPFRSLADKTVTGKMVNAYKSLNVNDIPGRPIHGSSAIGTLDGAKEKRDDVYYVYLRAGETLDVSLTGSSGTDFDLYLYDSTAASVSAVAGMVSSSEKKSSSTETISYKATKAGYYYIDVYAFAGAGNYTLRKSQNYLDRAAGTYEDSNDALVYFGSWSAVSKPEYSGGTAKRLNEAGQVEFSFTGNQIEWIAYKDSDQGKANVYIDGKKADSPSLYSSTFLPKQSVFKQKLAYGVHTIRIEWTGDSDWQSSDAFVNVDSFVVTAAPETFTVTMQENDIGALYYGDWRTYQSETYSGGLQVMSGSKGDYVDISFTGTRVKLLGTLTPYTGGEATITVDHRSATAQTVSFKGDQKNQAAVYDSGELSNGPHVLRIVNTSPDPDYQMISVDAVIVNKATREEAMLVPVDVVQEYYASVVYEGVWNNSISRKHSGVSSKYTNVQGNYVEYTFDSNKIKVLGETGPNRGKANVYIDGQLVTDSPIDLYSSNYKYRATIYESDVLDLGKHTIRVVNAGEKNAQSSGTYLSIDAFLVVGAVDDEFPIEQPPTD